MMFTKQRLILLFSLFLLPNGLNAGTIDKAFKALQQYNYFDAKALFEKALKKEPSAANYGLAVIYSRTDNPFHNLDSAFSRFINLIIWPLLLCDLLFPRFSFSRRLRNCQKLEWTIISENIRGHKNVLQLFTCAIPSV
jgi:hypothetical protein